MNAYMPAKRNLHAVLTGDIVNSSRLPVAEEEELLKTLDRTLTPYLHEYYRGDSFQVYIEDPLPALKIALRCRSLAISLTEDYESIPYDMRISIGIGRVEYPVKKLSNAKGEAFLLSGRHLDKISKTDIRLIIVTENELANIGLKTLASYINSIFDHMTARQAQVISRLLAGETQQKIAEVLGKSKSSVHQLTVSGRWHEIEEQLLQFENLINHLI
jgi:hypothetical protein